MGRVVIVGYKSKDGKDDKWYELVKNHFPTLRRERLVGAREPIMVRFTDGTLIEIFEWLLKQAIESAHANFNVQKMWQEFSMVGDYVPASQVDERSSIFPEFTPV